MESSGLHFWTQIVRVVWALALDGVFFTSEATGRIRVAYDTSGEKLFIHTRIHFHTGKTRDAPKSRIVDGRVKQEPKIQSVQRKIEGMNQKHMFEITIEAQCPRFFFFGIVFCICSECSPPSPKDRRLEKD